MNAKCYFINGRGELESVELEGIKWSAKDYMSGACSHDEYYQQFVTPRIKAFVESTIGRDNIIKSTGPYMNDIPLSKWDRISGMVQDMSHSIKLSQGTTYAPEVGKPLAVVSISTGVCLAKAAAKLIKQENMK